MGPNWSRTSNNDTSATQSGTILYDANVTFYPTSNNEPVVTSDAEEIAKEIERLEKMMHAVAYHDDNKHALQHKEVKRARCAPMKHKKAHMTKRIIR